MAPNGEAWPATKIQDLSSYITVGFVGSMSSLFVDEGVPLLRGQNIRPYLLDLTNLKYISPETHRKWKKSALVPGDVAIVRVGYPGTACVIPKGIGALNAASLVIVRPNPRLLDSKFLCYVLNSEWGKGQIRGRLVGSAQQVFNTHTAAELEIPAPPLPVQRRIAGILSAYDELMENCQRRIRILKRMARVLYREWFIHFRFSGHEKVPRVDSPLGPIPKGWEVKSIADICESVSYGYTASATKEEGGPKFLRITDIVPDLIDWASVPFCKIPEDKAPKYLVKLGDVVVARTGATTGYAKRLNRLHPDTVFASYLVRVRANPNVSNRMLGILMESDDYKQFIQTNIGGAAQPQANAVVLTSMRLAVPPSSVCQKFDRLVEPMIDEVEVLAVKIQNLRRTRDLLLPRLLSGQVPLDVCDVPVEPEEHRSPKLKMGEQTAVPKSMIPGRKRR